MPDRKPQTARPDQQSNFAQSLPELPPPGQIAESGQPDRADQLLTAGAMLAFSLAGQPGAAMGIGEQLLKRKQAAQELTIQQMNFQARWQEESRRRLRFLADERQFNTNLQLELDRRAARDVERADKAKTEARLERGQRQEFLLDAEQAYRTAITGFRTDAEQLVAKHSNLQFGPLFARLLAGNLAAQVQAEAEGFAMGDRQELIRMTAEAAKSAIGFTVDPEAGAMSEEQMNAQVDQMAAEFIGLYEMHGSTLFAFPDRLERFTRFAPNVLPVTQADVASAKARAIITSDGEAVDARPDPSTVAPEKPAPEEPSASAPQDSLSSEDKTPKVDQSAEAAVPATPPEKVRLTPDDSAAIAHQVGDAAITAMLDNDGLTFQEWDRIAEGLYALWIQDRADLQGQDPQNLLNEGSALDSASLDLFMHQMNGQIMRIIDSMDAHVPFDSEEDKLAMGFQLGQIFAQFVQYGEVPEAGLLLNRERILDTPARKAASRKAMKTKPFGEASPETKKRRARLRVKGKRK